MNESIISEVLKAGDYEVVGDIERAYTLLSGKAMSQPDTMRVTTRGDSFGLEKFSADHGVAKSAKEASAEDLAEMAKNLGLEWEEGDEDRVINYWSSDQRVDRAGDIVIQDWLLKDYEKAPLVCFGHDWEGLPIGNSIETVVLERSDDEYKGPALFQRFLFAKKEVYPFADTVYRMVKAGFLRQASVGMFPQEMIHVKSESDRKRLGLGPKGMLYAKNKLIETSPVTVPCLPSAMVANGLKKMAEKKELREGDLEAVRSIFHRFGEDASKKNEVDKVVREVWGGLFGKKGRQSAPAKKYMFTNRLGNKFFDLGDVVTWKEEGEVYIGRITSVASDEDAQYVTVRVYVRDDEGYYHPGSDIRSMESNKLSPADVPQMRYNNELKDLSLVQEDMFLDTRKRMLRLGKEVRAAVETIREAVGYLYKEGGEPEGSGDGLDLDDDLDLDLEGDFDDLDDDLDGELDIEDELDDDLDDDDLEEDDEEIDEDDLLDDDIDDEEGLKGLSDQGAKTSSEDPDDKLYGGLFS